MLILNPAAVWLLLSKGKTTAVSYLTASARLYTGYGKYPFLWNRSSWRSDILVPQVAPEELFPEIDFGRAPEILFPFPRELGVNPHELIFLSQLVRCLQPERILEFGTAEGRTTVNLALHAPEDAKVITINSRFDCENTVGVCYRNHPLASRITQILANLEDYDWGAYRNSIDFIFCDACDSFEGVAAETAIAFSIVRESGTILWHDYGTGRGRTKYLNQLSRRLPVFSVRDTCIVCLRVNTPEILEKVRAMAA
jgi:hypothetical protein